MVNLAEFLKIASKNCLKKGYEFRYTINTNYVYTFFLYKNGKKTKFTKRFDGTFLEDCQTTIFETADVYATALTISKELLTRVDISLLSKQGKRIRKLL